MWHIIEGDAGCAFAVEHDAVAIVVDALRASATAAMMFEAGAREIVATREVENARAALRLYPGALLAGERNGVPPEGFDLGNSPRLVQGVAGKRVVFTTTTGAGRLVSAWGARAVLMGTTVNAEAVCKAAEAYGRPIVAIPAGLAGDPDFDAQEDWAAAACLAMTASAEVGEGAEAYRSWRKRIENEGLERLFTQAPHAEKLRRAGLEEDIAYCARRDLTQAVPKAVDRTPLGVRVMQA